MSDRPLKKLLASDTGATTVEYAIAITGIAIAIFLVAGFLEASIASRVNSGRDCYTTVEIQDPRNTSLTRCL